MYDKPSPSHNYGSIKFTVCYSRDHQQSRSFDEKNIDKSKKYQQGSTCILFANVIAAIIFDSGDYFQLRKSLSEVEWNTVYNDDENKYTQNISHVLIEKASQSIPNKTVTINPHDPP